MSDSIKIIKDELERINEARAKIAPAPWKLIIPPKQSDIDKDLLNVKVVYSETCEIPFYGNEIPEAKMVVMAVNEITNLTKALNVAVEALEYMTMPITSEYPTAESLYETLNNDTQRGNEAINTIANILSDDRGSK